MLDSVEKCRTTQEFGEQNESKHYLGGTYASARR